MTEYRDINYCDIKLIKTLWENNRQYHEWTSEHFGHKYKGLVFEERVEGFSDINDNDMKITIAEDGEDVIAYCLSIIDNKVGELATLHVLHDKRKQGIGQELVNRHLQWLNSKPCREIKVVVSQENSQAISFYENLGFRPNAMEMIYKSE